MRTLEKYALLTLSAIAVVFIVACGGGGGGGGGGTVQDTTPPAIGSLAVSPSLLTVGVPAQISANVSDVGSGVQAVAAVITYPDNTQASVALQASGGSTYTGAFTAQWTPSGTGGDARVVLRAVDRAGNEATREISVRTAGSPPSPPF